MSWMKNLPEFFGCILLELFRDTVSQVGIAKFIAKLRLKQHFQKKKNYIFFIYSNIKV